MNIDCLVDFRNLGISITTMESRGNGRADLRLEGKPIKVGRLKDRKFIKLYNQIIEVSSVIDMRGILLIKTVNDEYYIIRVTLPSNIESRLTENIDFGYINIKLTKCQSLYEVIENIQTKGDGVNGLMLFWNSKGLKFINKVLSVDQLEQCALGIGRL
jgi:hypothetical protein